MANETSPGPFVIQEVLDMFEVAPSFFREFFRLQVADSFVIKMQTVCYIGREEVLQDMLIKNQDGGSRMSNKSLCFG